MRLKKGLIYHFAYSKYQKDPYPLVLVLYADNEYVHGINIHYLGATLTDKLIKMIALVAQKQLNGSNTRSLYHNWMKKNLPGVLRKAYRVYKTRYVKSPVAITKGYWGVESFLQKFKPKKLGEKHVADTTEQIKKIVKTHEKKGEEALRHPKKAITRRELFKNIDKYIGQMEQIVKEGRKDDLSKYTKKH